MDSQTVLNSLAGTGRRFIPLGCRSTEQTETLLQPEKEKELQRRGRVEDSSEKPPEDIQRDTFPIETGSVNDGVTHLCNTNCRASDTSGHRGCVFFLIKSRFHVISELDTDAI